MPLFLKTRNAALMLALSLIFLEPAWCQATDYEKLARQQFAAANYKEAAANLRLAMYKGAKTPAIWLLLGQCYEKDGEMGAARQTYQTVQKYFPSAPESTKAAEYLSRLPHVAPVNGTAGSAGRQSAANSPSSAAKGAPARELKDRIYVIAPRFDHPAVDPHTLSLVRSIVASLPRTVYKILDQGKTNVYVTPNLIDKFPDAVDFKNENLGRYLSDEHGRTYGRDVYICERRALRGGSTDLGPIPDDDTQRNFTYTFLAHALNDCLEMPSKDEQFLRLHKLDAANIDLSQDGRMKTFIAPVEGIPDTFAALAASIMGSKTDLAESASRNFPRCRAWIEQRIKILYNHLES